eukprot:COSAG06_NODE_53835_length_297_cov_9.606061_1_plen_66_part_00
MDQEHRVDAFKANGVLILSKIVTLSSTSLRYYYFTLMLILSKIVIYGNKMLRLRLPLSVAHWADH